MLITEGIQRYVSCLFVYLGFLMEQLWGSIISRLIYGEVPNILWAVYHSSGSTVWSQHRPILEDPQILRVSLLPEDRAGKHLMKTIGMSNIRKALAGLIINASVFNPRLKRCVSIVQHQ